MLNNNDRHALIKNIENLILVVATQIHSANTPLTLECNDGKWYLMIFLVIWTDSDVKNQNANKYILPFKTGKGNI